MLHPHRPYNRGGWENRKTAKPSAPDVSHGPYSEHLVLVLGNPSKTVRKLRLRLAAQIVRENTDRGEAVRAVIFSGYRSVPGEGSEALLMAAAWPGPAVPMLLDE